MKNISLEVVRERLLDHVHQVNLGDLSMPWLLVHILSLSLSPGYLFLLFSLRVGWLGVMIDLSSSLASIPILLCFNQRYIFFVR